MPVWKCQTWTRLRPKCQDSVIQPGLAGGNKALAPQGCEVLGTDCGYCSCTVLSLSFSSLFLRLKGFHEAKAGPWWGEGCLLHEKKGKCGETESQIKPAEVSGKSGEDVELTWVWNEFSDLAKTGSLHVNKTIKYMLCLSCYQHVLLGSMHPAIHMDPTTHQTCFRIASRLRGPQLFSSFLDGQEYLFCYWKADEINTARVVCEEGSMSGRDGLRISTDRAWLQRKGLRSSKVRREEKFIWGSSLRLRTHRLKADELDHVL